MQVTRVGDFTLGWGEGLVWDDVSQRLYFVDCAASTIHWLERGSSTIHTFEPPSMPTGLVPTDDGRLVAVLDDGLHLVDPDGASSTLLVPYPDELGGRCNDACADPEGNLITGKLELGSGEGSAWWYSAEHGWRLLDPDIANTNGPAVGVLDGRMTLIIGDTGGDYYSYDYDPGSGEVGARSVFGDTSSLDGAPDGSSLDAGGGLWCALVGGAQLARFTTGGLDLTLPVPVANPTDLTWGGPGLDRLYVVSIAGAGDLDGSLLAIDGLGAVGRPEPRYRLSPS